MSINTLLEVAVNAAYEGGSLALGWFRSGRHQVQYKEDNSPVTIADHRAEARIIDVIRAENVQANIIAEESGTTGSDSSVRWFVDPIDGTKSYIRGVPFWGTMIGVEVDGEMTVGVVYIPALNEMYTAIKERGAYLNNRRMRVSMVDTLSDAVLLSTDERKLRRSEQHWKGYSRLADLTAFQRTWGDCYGHMLVASGRAEVMVDPITSPWDKAALQVIIPEAGGVITTWEGDSSILGESTISSNESLARTVRDVLTSVE